MSAKGVHVAVRSFNASLANRSTDILSTPSPTDALQMQTMKTPRAASTWLLKQLVRHTCGCHNRSLQSGHMSSIFDQHKRSSSSIFGAKNHCPVAAPRHFDTSIASLTAQRRLPTIQNRFDAPPCQSQKARAKEHLERLFGYRVQGNDRTGTTAGLLCPNDTDSTRSIITHCSM